MVVRAGDGTATAPQPTTDASGPYDVQVTDEAGETVFSSLPTTISLGSKLLDLAPGARSKGKETFSLTSSGTFDVIAFTSDNPKLQTPPVRVVVSAQ